MKVIPICQRAGCDKPLVEPSDTVLLWIRDQPHYRGEQAAFCRACAAEITEEQKEER